MKNISFSRIKQHNNFYVTTHIFNIKYSPPEGNGIEIYYVYSLNVNIFYMPDHKGFYQFYFVFLQMKNENMPFKEIVAKLKLVPPDIIGEWNRDFNIERPQVEPQHHLYVELSPVADNLYHHQSYYFEETLDALRYELDELLYEKSSGMWDDSAGADEETFLIMLEETNSFCHRYLDSITITPISGDGFWIGFTLRETTEKLIKKGKKAIKFYMKWVYTRKQQLDFSWN